MKLRLYIDEDRIMAALVVSLRSAGFDVLTCTEARMLGRQDEEHLEFAAALERVLYTANVGDYARIHRDWALAGKSHSGIVVCNRQKWSIGEQVRRLSAVSERYSAAEMTSTLLHLSNFG